MGDLAAPTYLRTVLGDIDPTTMGGALPHEHLIVDEDSWWVPLADPLADPSPTGTPRLENLWHWLERPIANRGNLNLHDEDLVVREIEELPSHGIGTIFELTNVGLGRNVEGLRRISERSGVHVVAGAGYYVAGSLDEGSKAASEDEMFARIVTDVNEGVDGTGIKAGVIGEVGLSWPIEPVEERSLAAAVRAMDPTGAALTVHTPYFERDVEILREIADRIRDLGADMDRVVLGHCDSFTRDPRFLDVVPEFGCAIEIDLLGLSGQEQHPNTLFTYPSDEQRVTAVQGLVEAGHADRVLLSQDVALKTSLRAYGGHGYAYLPRVIVPWLRQLGVEDAAIEQMIVGNPQRIFPIRPSWTTEEERWTRNATRSRAAGC
jgi:phosphotriesterase-related protein